MKCILMNKNTEVLVAEYNDVLKVFTYIYEIKNIDYAPLILFNSYNNDKNITPVLTNWFKGRSIPSWKDDLDLLIYDIPLSKSFSKFKRFIILNSSLILSSNKSIKLFFLVL